MIGCSLLLVGFVGEFESGPELLGPIRRRQESERDEEGGLNELSAAESANGRRIGSGSRARISLETKEAMGSLLLIPKKATREEGQLERMAKREGRRREKGRTCWRFVSILTTGLPSIKKPRVSVSLCMQFYLRIGRGVCGP